MSSARAPGVSREAGCEACRRGMVAEPMSREGAGNRTRLTGRLVIYYPVHLEIECTSIPVCLAPFGRFMH